MLDISDFKSAEPPIRFFEEISKIPRGSGNTGAVADYLEAFAKGRRLFCMRDEHNNVIIRKPATVGREDRPGIIFQGHTDIVAEKTKNVNIDMQKERLSLFRDGDFLRANGTTLGADDGIAVAYALAVLDSDSIEHPEFEAIFTSDEEIGLIGASGLDATNIKGRMLINIDSDDEGIFTAGCAGGVRTDITLPIRRALFCGKTYRLSLSGLTGGHSGIEIDKGRGNAIKKLAEMLYSIPRLRLVSLCGGNADNAIPRDAEAVFMLTSPITDFELSSINKIINSLKRIEPAAEYSLCEIKAKDIPLDGISSAKAVSLIMREPSGVISMSRDIEGLVETSLNIGIARLDKSALSLSFSIRSSVNRGKLEVCERVRQIAEGHGARVTYQADYPAWEYRKDSYLRNIMCEVYEDMYGKAPKVVTIHAGLECGILTDKIPGLDCISIGPDNFDIHTPNEHLSLSSATRVWEYLIEVLRRI